MKKKQLAELKASKGEEEAILTKVESGAALSSEEVRSGHINDRRKNVKQDEQARQDELNQQTNERPSKQMKEDYLVPHSTCAHTHRKRSWPSLRAPKNAEKQ